MILDHLRLEDRFACASHQSTDSSQTCQQLPTLTFDHILAANKTAMSIARQVISCRCAAKDPHLTFLHASVFSKIIFWYRVASRIISAAAVNIPDDLNKQTAPSHDDSLNNMDEHLNGASQIGNQSSSDGHFSLNPVTVLPFTIGAFELESVDRAILSCELLLSELRKVGRLLEVFQAGQADWRNEVSTEGPQVSAPAAGEGPMGGLHAMLGKWLKRELQKTFESIHHQRMTRLST
ncbi:hypothetical protein MMC10_000874 [Thelotrema lepadinum]|nr:hypothetical protein [Thelotrema lepadinum]